MMGTAERHILLVEDNPGDVRLTQEILKNSPFTAQITVIDNGDDAINYLLAAINKKELPDLIILDLNLPRKSGIEVLEAIKNERILKLIPVVVLTSSEAENDIHQSYFSKANSYITKPVDFDEYYKVVTNIEKFWFSIAKLPD